LTQLRVPAVEADPRYQVLRRRVIEMGKRMNGPMADYYKALDSAENVLRHLGQGV
jgi:thiosulfate reductase / polysulfide reductase chain A